VARYSTVPTEDGKEVNKYAKSRTTNSLTVQKGVDKHKANLALCKQNVPTYYEEMGKINNELVHYKLREAGINNLVCC
jgi:hypothetical protein